MNSYDKVINAVVAIKQDEDLRNSFIKILQVGTYSQQVRVEKIKAAVALRNPPDSVIQILELLKNDKLAGLVLNALKQ